MKVFIKTSARVVLGFLVIVLSATVLAEPVPSGFIWPEGKKMALSLSFDDARPSQIDKGMPLLDKYGVKATFYLVLYHMEQRIEGWRQAVENGHEMGNHTLSHPCTGNF